MMVLPIYHKPVLSCAVWQVDVFLIRQYIMALQANFPERLYRILVVPTGMYVRPLAFFIAA